MGDGCFPAWPPAVGGSVAGQTSVIDRVCLVLVPLFNGWCRGLTLAGVEWIEIVEVLSVDGEFVEVKLPDTSVEWWPRSEVPDDVLPGDSLVVDHDAGTGIHLLPRMGGISA